MVCESPSESKRLPPCPPDADAGSSVNPSVALVGAERNLNVAGFTPVTANSNNRRTGFSGKRRIGVFGASVKDVEVKV